MNPQRWPNKWINGVVMPLVAVLFILVALAVTWGLGSVIFS